MPETPRPVVVAGATGYIGGLLVRHLASTGTPVYGLARDPQRAGQLEGIAAEVRQADVLDPESLENALDGADVAYYLVHSMGRGSDSDFAERDKKGAANFRRAAEAAGIARIVYMGGLGGDDTESEHLQSRHDTAKELMNGDIPVTYLRAAAVIGADSESFRMVRHLAKNLPAMVTPRWVDTKTQPVAIADVIAYLAAAATAGPEVEREIEIGGPDVVSYGGMMDEVADALGKRKPLRISVPFLTPGLSSLWIGLVTPVDTGVARPLIEGLTAETIVTDRSGMEVFDVDPMPLRDAIRAAIKEESDGFEAIDVPAST